MFKWLLPDNKPTNERKKAEAVRLDLIARLELAQVKALDDV